MEISLTESMERFVEEQVAAGEYSNVSEYMCELVRADQKRHAKEQLEQVLLSAVNSGDPMDVTADMVEQVRQRLRGRQLSRIVD
jgi:antitoxin ParD1/3/4